MLSFNHIFAHSLQNLPHDDVAVLSQSTNKPQLKPNQEESIINILIDELKNMLQEQLNLKVIDPEVNLFYIGMDSNKVEKFVKNLNAFQSYYIVSTDEIYQHTSIKSLAKHLCARFFVEHSQPKLNSTKEIVSAKFYQVTGRKVKDLNQNLFYQGLDSNNLFNFVDQVQLAIPHLDLKVGQVYRMNTANQLINYIQSQTKPVVECCKDPICNVTKALAKVLNNSDLDLDLSFFYQGLDSSKVLEFVTQLRNIYLDIHIDAKDVYTNDSIRNLAKHISTLL